MPTAGVSIHMFSALLTALPLSHSIFKGLALTCTLQQTSMTLLLNASKFD